MSINSIIKKIILVTIFLLPFIIFKYSFYPFIFPKSLFFEGMTLILATLWIIERLSQKTENRIPKNIVLPVFAVYVLALAISGIFGFVPQLSFWGSIDHGTGVVFMLSILIFSAIIASVFKKIEDWYKLLSTFIISGIIFNFGTLLSVMGVSFSKVLSITSDGGMFLGNSSWAGVYLTFVFFISLGIILSSKIKSRKIIGTLGLVTTFLNPSLTGFFIQDPYVSHGLIGLAKTASYSLLAGVGLFILYFLFRKISSLKWRKIFLWSFATISFVGIIYVSSFGLNSVRNLVSENAGPNRLIFWDIAVEGFKERPVLGWGGDSYQYVYAKYFDPIITSPGYAPEYWVDRTHNIFFDEIVSSGIVGTSLLILLYGVILFGLIRSAIKERGKEGFLYMGLFVAMVSFIIQGLMLFQINTGWILVSTITAFVASLCFKSKGGAIVSLGKNKKTDNSLNVIISILVLIAFCFAFNYVVIKPYNIARGLAEFPNMPYQERMDFLDKLDNAYMGNTTDLGNVFIPYHLRIRQILKTGLRDDEVKLVIEEIKKINKVLDNSLKKQKYQELKLLASEVGFYSVLTALSEGEERQSYYDKGMNYVDKMKVASPENPIINASKELLNASLKHGKLSLGILDDINK